MAILFEMLPSSVQVGGREYVVNTDFRCMAKFEQDMLTSDRGDKRTLNRIMLTALVDFYQKNIPPETDEAIEQMWWFYRCGEDFESKTNTAGTRNFKRLYDYDIDGALIISAFADTYGIDLVNDGLHWWLFRSYFVGLGENTRFVQIMSYRGVDLKDFKGEMRKTYARLQKKYALPIIKQTPLSPEERDEQFKRRLFGKR